MRHRRLAATAVLVASLLLPSTVSAASPIAGNDQAATSEDTPISMDLLRNDSDPDGDAIHLVSIMQGAGGYASVTPVAGWVLFTPNRNFNGTVTFTYTIADVGGNTASALAMVFVIAVNDPPVAFDRVATVSENGSVSILFQAIDPDKEGCDLIFKTELRTAHGTLTPFVDAGCSGNGDMATATYTPDPGYSGADSHSYVVSDGFVDSNFAAVSITVTPLPRVHVGDLDRAAIKGAGTWTASATVRVETATHAPQAGAAVLGVWSSGVSGSCTTSSTGTCVIGSGSIARKVQSTTFTVTSVTSGSAIYAASANHDPDGDSNGTSIAIARP